MRAGPRLRAGFTDVPVMGMPTMWIRTRLKPMDRPAKPFGTLSLVEPWMTRQRRNVRMTSAMRADCKE